MTRKLKVDLGTPERVETCLQTLELCTHIARDLIGDAVELTGPLALAALAGVFDEMIADVMLSVTSGRPATSAAAPRRPDK